MIFKSRVIYFQFSSRQNFANQYVLIDCYHIRSSAFPSQPSFEATFFLRNNEYKKANRTLTFAPRHECRIMETLRRIRSMEQSLSRTCSDNAVPSKSRSCQSISVSPQHLLLLTRRKKIRTSSLCTLVGVGKKNQ